MKGLASLKGLYKACHFALELDKILLCAINQPEN